MKLLSNAKKPLFRQKKVLIPVSIFAVLLVFRMILPSLVVKEANKFMANFSPIFEGHIDDFDLSIIRGAYRVEGVTAKMKANGETFLTAGKIEVSMAWRELFKGKILLDVVASNVDAVYSNKLMAETKKFIGNKDAKEAKKKAFPLDVERFDLRDSSVTMQDYPGLKPGEKFQVSDIEARVTNLTPKKSFPLSFFNVKATILGDSTVKATGKLNLVDKPLQWDVDSELQALNLTTLNSLLKKKVPLTFTKGSLDVFAEAKSENGKVDGYIKPFFKNLDIVKNEEDFKGAKHWGIEVITAVTNLLLRATDTKSVATKIPFTYDKEFKVDADEALEKVIQHGYEEKLKPGIENQIEIE